MGPSLYIIIYKKNPVYYYTKLLIYNNSFATLTTLPVHEGVEENKTHHVDIRDFLIESILIPELTQITTRVKICKPDKIRKNKSSN